jgi:PGF-CTERM protein
VSQQFSVDEADKTVSIEMRRTPALNVEAISNRVVVGEPAVLNATDEYGTPVAGASVTIDGEQVGQTTADGQAAVRINRTGTVTITVRDDRGLSESVAIESIGGESDETPVDTTATATEQSETDSNDSDSGSGEDGPGFGVMAALAALVVAVVLARRH